VRIVCILYPIHPFKSNGSCFPHTLPLPPPLFFGLLPLQPPTPHPYISHLRTVRAAMNWWLGLLPLASCPPAAGFRPLVRGAHRRQPHPPCQRPPLLSPSRASQAHCCSHMDFSETLPGLDTPPIGGFMELLNVMGGFERHAMLATPV
jgi:hypothetical protein